MKPHRQKKDASVVECLEAELFEAIAMIKTAAEAKRFFYDLCSPAEIQSMADRWQVVDLLKKEIPYRKIYETTKVSVTTVGRVARSIMFGEGGYNLIYQRKMKNKAASKQDQEYSKEKKAEQRIKRNSK